MFHVTLVHLASDLARVSADFDDTDLGELSGDEFAALLNRFSQIDATQNSDADPHLLVQSRTGRHRIRTGQGKLFLYDARDTTVPYVELAATEIVAQLDRAPAALVAETEAAPVKEAAPHRGIAIAILLAGLALNGYTLYSVFYSESVNEKPKITLLTAGDELTAHQQEVVGTYATGAQAGDRVIVVGVDGSVKFSEIGNSKSVNNGADTYRLGRREKKYCLSTPDNGVIDIVDIDTLVYYRDTYKRR